MTDEKTTRPIGYTERLLNELRAGDLPIPSVLVGEPKPLALSTRSDLPAWCSARGFDETAIKILSKAIAAHVRSGGYREAVAAELAVRHDLDGEPTGGPVSEMDRHSAALSLHARALKEATEQKTPAPGGLSLSLSSPAQKAVAMSGPLGPQRAVAVQGLLQTQTTVAKLSATPPQAQAARSFRVGVLTPGELERRRAVLAGIKK